ncbi:Hematopoietic prostaglandin d synthase [Globisporangium polare]
MSPTPQLKLTYFDFSGRAELARLLFTFSGVAFEDSRISKPAFGAMKTKLPLGQLPTLQVDGVVFSQSMAIARYAAKLSGQYPHDPVQALHVDMVSETLVDLGHVFADIMFRTPDAIARAEKTTKLLTETVPKVFTALEDRVQGKFFAGDSATLVDVQLLDMVINFKTSFPECSLAAYPKMEAVVENVKANAHIAAYLAK